MQWSDLKWIPETDGTYRHAEIWVGPLYIGQVVDHNAGTYTIARYNPLVLYRRVDLATAQCLLYELFGRSVDAAQ